MGAVCARVLVHACRVPPAVRYLCMQYARTSLNDCSRPMEAHARAQRSSGAQCVLGCVEGGRKQWLSTGTLGPAPLLFFCFFPLQASRDLLHVHTTAVFTPGCHSVLSVDGACTRPCCASGSKRRTRRAGGGRPHWTTVPTYHPHMCILHTQLPIHTHARGRMLAWERQWPPDPPAHTCTA